GVGVANPGRELVEGTRRTGVRVGAEEDLARPGVPLLRERDVADAFVAVGAHVVEVRETLLSGELAQDVDVPMGLVVLREDVVVGDQDDAVAVPDARLLAELPAEDADRARPAHVVGHEDVGRDPDVVAGLDRGLPGGARQDLLRHRHRAHGPTSAPGRSCRYWRRYSSLLSAFT